jgi:hypothetical protein
VLLVALILLSGATPGFRSGEKPSCSAARLHEFWPAEANVDPKAVVLESRCGRLEMCTRNGWRYSWRKLTLRAGDRTPSECYVPLNTGADSDEPAKLVEDGR